MKWILASALFFLSFDASACSVTWFSASPAVNKAILDHGWQFSNYDSVCERLRSSKADLAITGMATVLSGTSIAWASVGLKDKNTFVTTFSHGGMATRVNDVASMDVAKFLMIEAISEAVDNIVLEEAIDELNRIRSSPKSEN